MKKPKVRSVPSETKDPGTGDDARTGMEDEMLAPEENTSFDRDTMLERMGGDTELLAEVVELFLEDGPRMLDTVRDAVSERDAHNVERSAHSLKGALLNMAAERAAGIALELERMGREESLDTSLDILNRLEEEMERLQQELKDLEA
jgi:HPt (histidine-containing phosphotransfer) domain-containing protein